MLNEVKIITEGFEPALEFLEQIKQHVEYALEYCPDNSYPVVYLEKDVLSFGMMVSIRHSSGEFLATCKSNDLSYLLEEVLDRLYCQIHVWRQKRFEATLGAPYDTIVSTTPLAQLPKETPNRTRVLIVDDDQMSTRLLRTCLEKMNCSIKTASSGFEAVAEMVSCNYDLVFLDWIMPDMNGGETLRSAQNRMSYDPIVNYEYAAHRLPVITFSGKSNDEIKFPECAHFQRLGHWSKSISIPDMVAQASLVLTQIKNDNVEIYE